MNPTLASLLQTMDVANNKRKEIIQTKVDERNAQFTQAHEGALKDLFLGVDWEIDEVQAQLDEDQFYLDELLAIREEAYHDAN